ncbi:hypothetical protein [Streptodolium elevatio]|uniref:Secreted protein n=1 Tax=Streptodolium elevatio TaxID=3157996 RepID=A0ABV3DS36_9ACTN
MIKRGRVGLGRVGALAGAVAAVGVALPGTAAAVSADGGDIEGVTVWRAPGQIETLTGDVWTMRGCAYGLFPPHVAMSCRYQVTT